MQKDYRKEAFEKTKQHWEHDVSNSIFPKTRKNHQLDNFEAKAGKEWPRTHVKINETDY